jgi:uncharacterized RDD family membrane protein YckC
LSRIPGPSPDSGIARQGHYAGVVSRLAGFAVDIGAAWGLATVFLAILSFTSEVITGRGVLISSAAVAIPLYTAWLLVYFAYQWTLSGRTIGMAILGVRVVRSDGSPIDAGHAVLRIVTFPLGILTLGVGFVLILVQRERRALYDLIADTAVVYSWDARAARLRWLGTEGHGTAAATPTSTPPSAPPPPTPPPSVPLR